MDYAIVIVPAAPVRKKSKHQSEMTNQLLFGEGVKVLKEKGSLWIKVRSLYDNYEGWMTNTLVKAVSEEEAKAFCVFVTADRVNNIQLENILLQVPAGASLPSFQNGEGKIGDWVYKTEATVHERTNAAPEEALVKRLTAEWLNSPYQWGGKTIFGVDCSGFVQINYKRMGVDLPRDAWQQAQEGRMINKLKEAKCGDLAFFDDKEEIVHVGILLDQNTIIHASGKVRIDQIDKKGIINTDTGKRTHSLRVIKRLW